MDPMLPRSWGERVRQYMGLYAKIHLAPSSRRRMQIVLAQFGAHLAGFPEVLYLSEITRNHIETYQLARVQAGKSPATVNADIRHLRAFLRRATLDGWIPKDPSEGVKLVRVPKRLAGTREPAEVTAIVSAFRRMREPFWADLVILVVNTGLRLGEALALRTNDAKSGRLHVRVGEGFMPKDREERLLPLNPTASAVIQKRVLALGGKEGALLWPSRKGTAMDQNQARKKLYFAAALAKVPHTTWQSLRRTFATVSARTVPELALMALGGWSDPRTVKKFYTANLLNDLPPPPTVVG